MSGLGKVLTMMASIIVAPMMNPAVANADSVTYTVEPFSFDGVLGMTFSVTKNQLGGALCPCVKVPYTAPQSAGNLNVVVVSWGDTAAPVISVYD